MTVKIGGGATLSRRGFMAGGAVLASTLATPALASKTPDLPTFDGRSMQEIYGHIRQNRWDLHAIPVDKVNPRFLRTRIVNTIKAPIGSMLVDTGSGHLYFFDSEKYGIRYGIAVARDGFLWRGTGVIARRVHVGHLARRAITPVPRHKKPSRATAMP